MKTSEAADIIDNILQDCLSKQEREHLMVYSMGVLSGKLTNDDRFWFALEHILGQR